MKIEEGILFANYLGWRETDKGGYMIPNLYPYKEDTGETEFNPDQFEFDFRADWLMPVVEKIMSHMYADGDTAFFRTFGRHEETNLYMVRINRCPLHESISLQQAMYAACLEFITFENNNQS